MAPQFHFTPAVAPQTPDLAGNFMQLLALARQKRRDDLAEKEANLRLTELQRVAGDQQAMRQAQAAGVRSGPGFEMQPAQTMDTMAGPINLGQLPQPADPSAVRVDNQAMLQSLAGSAPHLVPGMQAQQAEQQAAQRKQQLEEEQIISKLSGEQLTQLKATYDIVDNAIGGLLALPSEQRPTAYSKVLAGLPPQLQQVAPQQYPGDEGLMALAAGSERGRALIDARLRQQAIDKPTANEQDFQSFYRPWLESNGLKKNAKNEMDARDAFAKKQRTPTLLTPEEEAQHIRIAQAGRAGDRTGDEKLVEAVLADPSVLSNLTAESRKRIEPKLAERGFTDFTKPLTEGAMGKMAESRSAVASLKDLRQTLQENEQYIGPIAGLEAKWPYSPARKAQAKIDLVRQRVGKALEGGVLRKEDEEKYKKILATLRDTPELAISKVDGLIQTIERDLDIFEKQQRAGGRRVETPAAAGPGENDRLGIR